MNTRKKTNKIEKKNRKRNLNHGKKEAEGQEECGEDGKRRGIRVRRGGERTREEEEEYC